MDAHKIIEGIFGSLMILAVSGVAKILWDMRSSLTGINVLVDRVLTNDLPHMQNAIENLDTKLDRHMEWHSHEKEKQDGSD